MSSSETDRYSEAYCRVWRDSPFTNLALLTKILELGGIEWADKIRKRQIPDD